MTVSTDAAFTLADRGLGRIDYRAAPPAHKRDCMIVNAVAAEQWWWYGHDPSRPNLSNRPGQVLMADKGYRSATFEAELNAVGITLIRLPRVLGDRLAQTVEQLGGPVPVDLHRLAAAVGVTEVVTSNLTEDGRTTWVNGRPRIELRADRTARRREADSRSPTKSDTS